jgi:hypothetical protein
MGKPVIIASIDLPKNVLAALKQLKMSQREAIDLAVEKCLPKLVESLTSLRLLAAGDVGRRPRYVSREAWQALGNAAEKLDVSRPVLLRACLRQLVEQSRKVKQ